MGWTLRVTDMTVKETLGVRAYTFDSTLSSTDTSRVVREDTYESAGYQVRHREYSQPAERPGQITVTAAYGGGILITDRGDPLGGDIIEFSDLEGPDLQGQSLAMFAFRGKGWCPEPLLVCPAHLDGELRRMARNLAAVNGHLRLAV